jgi:hypothetical protein
MPAAAAALAGDDDATGMNPRIAHAGRRRGRAGDAGDDKR